MNNIIKKLSYLHFSNNRKQIENELVRELASKCDDYTIIIGYSIVISSIAYLVADVVYNIDRAEIFAVIMIVGGLTLLLSMVIPERNGMRAVSKLQISKEEYDVITKKTLKWCKVWVVLTFIFIGTTITLMIVL